MIEGHIGSPTKFLLRRMKPVFFACCNIPVFGSLATLQQWLDTHFNRPQSSRGGVEVQLYSFFNFGARWGGRSTPRPGRFIPGKDPVPILQEDGQAPRPVLTGGENLARTGIRYPECPAPGESLHRLSYPGAGRSLPTRTETCFGCRVFIFSQTHFLRAAFLQYQDGIDSP